MKKLPILFCLALLLVFAALPCYASAAEEGQPVASFEAAALFTSAQADSEALEAEYLGKRVAVTGVVVETGISIYATPYVRLSDKAGGETCVVCVLPRLDAAKLTSFKKGDVVTLAGRFYRAREGRVVLKECTRVEP